MQEKTEKRNPYPLKIEGQGSWSVEDTFLYLALTSAMIQNFFDFVVISNLKNSENLYSPIYMRSDLW